MNAGTWMLDETQRPSLADIERIEDELAERLPGTRAADYQPTLALSMHDVTIHDTRKWFGGADIRVDALVVTGCATSGGGSQFYMPRTATFSGIRDGEQLRIGTGGLLAFHGPVAHFLDVSVMVSRDRKDTADLAALFGQTAQSDELKDVTQTMMGLMAVTPPVAAVSAAIAAASTLGNLALKLLHASTGATIGVYRNCHLQYRDGFGIGRHPDSGAFRANDLSFWYDISLEQGG